MKNHFIFAVIVVGFAMVPAGAQAPVPGDGGLAIDVRAETIESFDPREPQRTRFGDLEFRGGLILSSPSRNFGGLSSLRVSPDGARFLTASDKGQWFRGRIVYRDGKPTGLTEVETAPMLGADGRSLASRGWYDTESITEDNGTVYVGIERVHQIVRFDFGKEGFRARGVPIALPPEVRKLPSNKSLECVAMPAKGQPLAGTLIAVSERGLDAQGNIKAFLINGRNFGLFSVKRSEDFDISDCTTTPRGDLLLLERRFSWATGVAMRIRRIALTQIKPDALVDGPALIYADMGFQIDNMEGISVHRSASGELVITLVSDDNFSPLQRNLLLQFTLVGE